MVKENYIEIEGTVENVIKDKVFVKAVLGDDVKTIICTVSGKIRMSGIKLLPSDRVLAEVSIYNLEMGRITYRLKD